MLELQKIASFEAALLDYARRNHSEFMAELTKTGNYNDEVKASLKRFWITLKPTARGKK